jgi:methylase of polypeptide subunit release factors
MALSSAELKRSNELDVPCEGSVLPVVFSPSEVVELALSLAKVGHRDVVADLGCGDGRALLTAALEFNAHGYGIDVRPCCIQACQKTARIHRVRSQRSILGAGLVLGDLEDLRKTSHKPKTLP